MNTRDESIKKPPQRRAPDPVRSTLPLVSVIVPAFNEAAILERNLSLLCDYMESLEKCYRWEILVINDGSADDTGRTADTIARERKNVRVFHHPYNFRLGQALRTGFRQSRGDVVVVMDIDLSYSPDHIERMLDRMKETRAKIVIASPYAKGGRVANVPLLRRWLSYWANRFLCLMATKDFFSDKLTTITGMVRAYDGYFIRRLHLWAMDVDVNAEIINKAKLLRARIVEIPAHLDWRSAPKKKSGGRRKSSLRLIRTIIQSVVSGFLLRPFLFFIFPGISLFVLSLYPLAWTLIHTLDEFKKLAGTDLSFGFRLSDAVGAAFELSPHAFIVGGIVLMVAVQLVSFGLLSLQKKRYFIELFYLTHSSCAEKSGEDYTSLISTVKFGHR